MMDSPAAVPEPRRISGRVIVLAFAVFTITGALSSVLLARHMRPATMAAAAKAMPLSGTIRIDCLEPGTREVVDLRQRGICSSKAKLELSLPNPGVGVKSLSYLLLSRSPQEALIAGQFPPNGKATVDLSATVPEYHVAVFVYGDSPLSLTELTNAVKSAPAGNVPEQIKALEKYCGKLMHADPQHPREIRTARVEMKIVPE